jgi:hypothetical protein
LVFPGIEKHLIFVCSLLKPMHLLDDSMVGRHRTVGLSLMLSVGTTADATVVNAFVVSKSFDVMCLERDGGIKFSSFNAGPHHMLEERSVATKVV